MKKKTELMKVLKKRRRLSRAEDEGQEMFTNVNTIVKRVTKIEVELKYEQSEMR